MAKQLLTLALTLLITFSFYRSFAGKEVGNGGHVWLCYDQKYQLTSMLSADAVYFKATTENNLKYCNDWKKKICKPDQSFCISQQQQDCNEIKNLLDSELNTEDPFVQFKNLLEYYRLKSPIIYEKIKMHFEFVLNQLEFVEIMSEDTTDVSFYTPGAFTFSDINYKFNLMPDWPNMPACDGHLFFRNIAIYYPNSNKIFISRNFWNNPKLSNYSRFAILVHEAMYNYIRWSAYSIPQSNLAPAIMTSIILNPLSLKAKESLFKNSFMIF